MNPNDFTVEHRMHPVVEGQESIRPFLTEPFAGRDRRRFANDDHSVEMVHDHKTILIYADVRM